MLELTKSLVEQRVPVEHHKRFAERRSIPAIYIVGRDGMVLFSRTDPDERRRDLQSTGARLPALIEDVVQKLSVERSRMSPMPDTLVSAPNASLLVRLIWLEGVSEAIAVLVERFRIRDYLASARRHYDLTVREAEVLSLLVNGLRNAEIATRLHVSPSTAIFHVKRLLVKMDARNRTELVSKFLS